MTKQKMISLLLSICLVVTMASTTIFAADFNRETLDGVVMVMETAPVGDGYLNYFGTGFFIGEVGENPQYLVTSCYVIQEAIVAQESSQKAWIEVVFDADTVEEAYLVDYDTTADLAILRLDQPTDLRKPILVELPDVEMTGQSVYTVGYPFLAESIDAISEYGVEDASVLGGQISRFLTESGTGRPLLQTSSTIHEGVFGGPVVTANGGVVAISVPTMAGAEVESLNYAVTTTALVSLLKNNSIAYDEVGATVEPEGINPLYLALSGVLLLAVIAIVVILLVKKKKQQSAQVATPVAAPSTGAAQMMLRATSSQHGGVTIPLHADPITLGRDANVCLFPFRADTPGVSARHCTLQWNQAKQAVLLTDLKSSYGTHLENGQQIQPGVPFSLGAGDSFYLGDKGNTFRIERL